MSGLLYPIVKAALSGIIIMAVSEIARRYAALGALIASLPLISLLAIIWLWNDTADAERIAAHAEATFWYVLPTLPMFLVFPVLLPRIGFWPTLLACVVMTVVLFAGFGLVMRRFGVELLS